MESGAAARASGRCWLKAAVDATAARASPSVVCGVPEAEVPEPAAEAEERALTGPDDDLVMGGDFSKKEDEVISAPSAPAPRRMGTSKRYRGASGRPLKVVAGGDGAPANDVEVAMTVVRPEPIFERIGDVIGEETAVGGSKLGGRQPANRSEAASGEPIITPGSGSSPPLSRK